MREEQSEKMAKRGAKVRTRVSSILPFWNRNDSRNTLFFQGFTELLCQTGFPRPKRNGGVSVEWAMVSMEL